MGTLGRYLHDARVARGIDLREAAQQTRIRGVYLRALEEEDFSKLPGDVFVKGFLKNYGKFLNLDETELMRQYNELFQPAPVAGTAGHVNPPAAEAAPIRSPRVPLEPFIWGAGIIIVLIILLLVALPGRQHSRESRKASETPITPSAARSELTSTVTATVPEKLYLEVLALDNTWLLVRTDASPQKKAFLKKGESLIWSADQRFLLSYGSAGAVKLLLNGQELMVDEPKTAVVRDLVVTASGIMSHKTPTALQRATAPRRKETPAIVTQQSLSAVSKQTTSVRARRKPPGPASPPPLPTMPPAPGAPPNTPAQ